MSLTEVTTQYNNLTLEGEVQKTLPVELTVFLTLQQIIFAGSCGGNLFVIFIILKYLGWKDMSYVFIFNLAVADFFTGIGSGIQIFYIFYPELNTIQFTCFLRSQLIGAMTLSSQVTVFLLSLDRYVSVCHHDFWIKIMTHTKAVIIVACTLPWAVSLLTTIAVFTGWNSWTDGAYGCSYIRIFPTEYFWFISFVIFVLSFLSFLTHCGIFVAVRRFYRRVNPQSMGMNDLQLQKRIKGGRIMLIITICFTVCWLPYSAFTFAFANGYRENFSLTQLSPWLVFLGIINSVLNPFIYAWYKGDFRKASRKAFLCCSVLGTMMQGVVIM